VKQKQNLQKIINWYLTLPNCEFAILTQICAAYGIYDLITRGRKAVSEIDSLFAYRIILLLFHLQKLVRGIRYKPSRKYERYAQRMFLAEILAVLSPMVFKCAKHLIIKTVQKCKYNFPL